MTTALRAPAVAGWLRVTAAALAVPQLFTGLWAVLSPHGFYDHFPGIGAALVAAEPPYNMHLITDTGSGFLAVGVVLAFAALRGGHELIQLAAIGTLVFGIPHLIYHWAHPAESLSTAEQVLSVGLLAVEVAVAITLIVATRRES